MKILLTGATGFVGGHVKNALELRGHRVCVVGRQHSGNFADLLRVEDWLPHLQGVDAVINTVGIIAQSGRQRFDIIHELAPKALFQACAQLGVRVVQISALGADERAKVAFHLSKRAADDYLRSLAVPWFVLRPSLIYGAGGRSSRLFMRLAALPLIPLVGDGRQLVQPVHISDLVAAVLLCLEAPRAGQTLDVVGPTPFSFAQWLQLLRDAQGLGQGRFIGIPVALALWGCRLAQVLSALLQPDNLRMLLAGNTADVQPLRAFLGRPPLAFQSQLLLT